MIIKSIFAMKQLISDDSWVSETSKQPISLKLTDISYDEWQPSRTERCLDVIDRGAELAPIKVVGFALKGSKTIYDVGDGNHRCVAHERRNKDSIKAEVGGVYNIDPTKLCIYKEMVWSVGDDGGLNCISCDYLNEHLLIQIEKLGIRRL